MSKRNHQQGRMDQGQAEQTEPQPEGGALPEFEEEISSPRVGREMKIGLGAVVVLLGLLGYVIYGRFTQPNGQRAATAQNATKDAKAAPVAQALSGVQAPKASSSSVSLQAPAPSTAVPAAPAPPTNLFGSPSISANAWTLDSKATGAAPSSSASIVGDRYASPPAGYMPQATPAPSSDQYAGYGTAASSWTLGAGRSSPDAPPATPAAAGKTASDLFSKPATAPASTPPSSAASASISPPPPSAPIAPAPASPPSFSLPAPPALNGDGLSSPSPRTIPSQMATQAGGSGLSFSAPPAASLGQQLPAPPSHAYAGSPASAGSPCLAPAGSSPAASADGSFSSASPFADRYGSMAGEDRLGSQAAFSSAPASRLGSAPASLPAGIAATPSGRETLPVEKGLYTVQPNEDYWSISQKVYGTGAYFQALAEHNRARVPEADRLRAGDRIETPQIAVLEQRYPSLCPEAGRRQTAQQPAAPVGPSSRAGTRQYVVQEGDNLFNIARYELGKASRWSEIYELNRDALGKEIDYLTPGMTLILPGDATPVGTLTQQPSSITFQR